MYSTIDGAKKCAKNLKRLFERSGFVLPLHKCQTAIALAGGFRDWRDLEGALGRSARSVELATFRKRLVAALPEPCTSPLLAWLDDEPEDAVIAADTPARWYRDVFPYLFATAALHRGRTALLRPGSGTGQQLREKMVVGLLLNIHGGDRPVPWLEPDTLAIVFRGDLESLFRDEFFHPKFEVELEKLKAAGILEIERGIVKVNAPDHVAVAQHVFHNRTGKLRLWGVDGNIEAISVLRDALAAIGVRNALRVADAISQFGSNAYTTPSGPVLDLLSEMAAQGEIEIFAKVVGLLASVHPTSVGFVKDAIPAKISSHYFARHRHIDASKIMSWANANPSWPDTLKSAVEKPAVFALAVDVMADAIVAGR